MPGRIGHGLAPYLLRQLAPLLGLAVGHGGGRRPGRRRPALDRAAGQLARPPDGAGQVQALDRGQEVDRVAVRAAAEAVIAAACGCRP